MPLDRLIRCCGGIGADIAARGANLKYNHILIAAATVAEDRAGDNFAFMTADKDVLFHRVSKLDFLGESYHNQGTATYMMEYTYRDGDPAAAWSAEQVREAFTDGLIRIGFVESAGEVLLFTARRFPYAYVIYDAAHKQNMAAIRQYFGSQGLLLNGRFGNFEYWNMDRVVSESRKLAESIGKDFSL